MWVTENPPFNLFSVKHGSRIPGGCCRYILTDFSTSPIPLPLPSCTFEMGTECVRKKRKRLSVCGGPPPIPNKKAEWVVVASAQQANAALNCKSRPFSPFPLLAAISAPPPKKAATHKKTFPPLQAAQQRKFRIKAREDGGKMMSVGGEALIWVSPLPVR